MKYINRLLIVEDNTEDQEVYHRYLSQSFSSIVDKVTKETGQSALDFLKKNEVDCILLDYQLPDMNGVDFLKQSSSFNNAPIIMLTGQG